MNILGVHTGHDLGACLLRDGKIVALIEEERLTRYKHGLTWAMNGLGEKYNGRFVYLPWASINYCLEVGGLALDELDAIMLPPHAGIEMDAGKADWASMIPIRDKRKIRVVREPEGGVHHHMHALTAFHASPFESAAVLVVDGAGTFTMEGSESESGYFFKNRRDTGRLVFKNRYLSTMLTKNGFRVDAFSAKSGLCCAYDIASKILGFVDREAGWWADAGKTMGLAGHGGPNPAFSGDWFRVKGSAIDFSGFHNWLLQSGLHKVGDYRTTIGSLIQNEKNVPGYAADLAFKVQLEFERAMLQLSEIIHKKTKSPNLCLAGGGALNSVANGLVLEKGPFRDLFVQPAAGDNGQAMGLAFAGHLALERERPIAPIRHAFGGRSYPDSEIEALLESTGLPYRHFTTQDSLAEAACKDIIGGKVVGWFQGGSEYGPRALGHRSLLADPRPKGIQDYLNLEVKFREPFRPLAPSILKEACSKVFEMDGEAPYMLRVARVKKSWRARVPGITHVDGTGRVQTVDAEVDPLYHALISKFYRKTGVPLVLNTSFNLRGMPIVETPFDALQCFVFSNIEVLYLEGYRIPRVDVAHLFLSPAFGWQFVEQDCAPVRGLYVETSLRKMGSEGKVDFPNDPFYLKLVELLDGKRSLKTALSKLGAPGARRSREALGFLQSLLRSGALKLRIGNVFF